MRARPLVRVGVYAPGGKARQFVQPGQCGIDVEPLAETLGKRGLNGLGEIGHCAAP
jgi:hypothetical protein